MVEEVGAKGTTGAEAEIGGAVGAKGMIVTGGEGGT